MIYRCFPKGSVMGKVFNRNNLKLSYRTLPNMKQVLVKHNKKVMAARKPKVEEKTCDCPKATREAGIFEFPPGSWKLLPDKLQCLCSLIQ